jgi:hypothetical protein
MDQRDTKGLDIAGGVRQVAVLTIESPDFWQRIKLRLEQPDWNIGARHLREWFA